MGAACLDEHLGEALRPEDLAVASCRRAWARGHQVEVDRRGLSADSSEHLRDLSADSSEHHPVPSEEHLVPYSGRRAVGRPGHAVPRGMRLEAERLEAASFAGGESRDAWDPLQRGQQGRVDPWLP